MWKYNKFSPFGLLTRSDTMIDAKDYFMKYLSWKRRVSNGPSSTICREAFSAMDADMLEHDAEQDNPGAMEELGERYLFGLSPFSQDVDRAISLLTAAKEAGHPDAAHLLSDIYRSDEYGRKDLEKYFQLLTEAAEMGSWRSMFNLAVACYKGKDSYEGYGPEQDKQKTFAWGMKCQKMTLGLMAAYFSNNSTKNFDDYFEHVYDIFEQSVIATSMQLINGDGVKKDIGKAREMVTYTQRMHQNFLKCDNDKFTKILAHCDKLEGKAE